MQETESIDEYILQHIDPESDYLKSLYRDTHVKLLRPRMASGHLQGRMLKMFVEMIRPRQVLEIGTYSGYSAFCLAEGLSEDGMLHTFEINDEQEDFTRPWLEKSPYADRIKFYIGDALELVPNLGVTFDMALSEIFLLQTKAMPGMLVSVSTVRISPDMSIARVYLSVFPSEKAEEMVKNINGNMKSIRYELGTRVRHQLRIIPELKFFVDDSLDYIEKIDSLLK